MKIKSSRPIIVLAVFFLLGIGHPAFSQSISFGTNSYATGTQPYSVIAADVYGIGRPAIITANQNDGTFTVLGNYANALHFSSNATFNAGSIKSVIAVDANGDGMLDLVSVSLSKTIVWTNNYSGSVVSNATINAAGLCAGILDQNGDGRPDLFIGTGSGVLVFTNDGSGRFASNITISVAGGASSIAFADLNNDGKSDLIAGNTVLTNDGSGLFVSNSIFPNAFTAGDINGDGVADLILSGTSRSVLILTNDGIGIFSTNVTLIVPPGQGVNRIIGVRAVDLNGDGLNDLIGYDDLSIPTTVVVWTNSNAGFGSYIKIIAGKESQAMALADLNGDNRPDVVLGNTASSVTVMLNKTIFPSPPLNISAVSGQAALYWKSPAPNSVLQVTTDLNNPNWTTVSNGVPITGVAVPGTSPSSFYRLISQ